MQKREEHQNGLGKKIGTWLKDYDSCAIHSSTKAKYTSVKQNGTQMCSFFNIKKDV